MKRGKCIIISAPSGTGKSTIIGWLMQAHPELRLAFSISCTSRPPRGSEQHGVEYFFLTPEEFRRRIDNDEFLEYEEVYENRFYGTLKAQVERQLDAGQLRRRLEGRATDAPEVIDQRIARAEFELTFAPQFDRIVVNDRLEQAESDALAVITDYLNQENDPQSL